MAFFDILAHSVNLLRFSQERKCFQDIFGTSSGNRILLRGWVLMVKWSDFHFNDPGFESRFGHMNFFSISGESIFHYHQYEMSI
jgi:hypothetical protein